MAPDIVNLFNQPGPTPAFAQGTLVTFDPLTGDNTVNVLGQVFTNLALLNVPDVVNMVAGSVVMLAQLGGSYAIMGRVIVPGSALLNTAAVGIAQGSGTTAPFTPTTTLVPYAAASVVVPAWANAMSFLVSANANAVNTTASIDAISAEVVYTGSFGTGFGGTAQSGVANGEQASAACSAAQHVIAVTPGETISFSVQVRSLLANWASNANNIISLDALCIFQRV